MSISALLALCSSLSAWLILRLDRLINLLYQNKGVLSKSKRGLYTEISDDELQRIQAAFQEAFAEQTLELADDLGNVESDRP